ncbi:LysE family translocator [Luteimonas sp. B3_2_R+30]|uniref:LysE family translocator n=2 Tax=Luteimonas salinilitoris TaxID=3237697 RepID=A0ABV4HNN1_9GAMM
MTQTAHLWLFFAMVAGIVLLPGLDMAFVLASALVGGRRAGLAATAGIVAGGVCHVTMGALGIVAVLQLVPAAFNAVLLAGAAYIAWIGITLLRSRAALGHLPQARLRTQAETFRRGLVTSLLNPKAYLFMLAIFPQFLRPEYGDVAVQAVVLWAIIAFTQAAIYGGMALAGDRARAWLASRPAANAWLARTVGALLLLTALYTAFEGWRPA